MQTIAILVASSQGQEVQKIIETNPNWPSLRVDCWRNETHLFDQLSAYPYGLLVIDFTLLYQNSAPESFFGRLQAVSPRTAVILLVKPEERQQAIGYLPQNAADYLLFPLDAVELCFRIERVLAMSSARYSSDSPAQLDPAADELLMLLEAGQEINQTLQLDEVLKIILSRADSVTGADLSRVFLTDRNESLTKDGSVIKTSPLSNQPGENSLLFLLAQEVAFSREIICRQRASSSEWPHQSLQSVLLMPMVARDKLIGVLALGSKRLSAFPDDQIRWLSVFCDRAAIAIENAHLFQDLSSAYIDLAQSREQILQSRNTLQALFDGITDDLYLVDHNLKIKVLNRGQGTKQAFRPEDPGGEDYVLGGWVKTAPELLARIKESLRTGRETTWIPSESEIDPYLKDREFRIYPIRNRLAQIEQVIVFAQDVSERRRWQASLFRSANLVAVGQLAGSIAHQINNPLTVAMANSQLILLETSPDSEAYDLAHSILKSTERMQGIVQNLLEFSNQETYFFVEIDLIETIEGALALVSQPLKKVKIQVIRDYQAQPRLSASVSHLKLVWMNLLLNARDALVDYAAQPQITISTNMVSSREVKITITDNGRGITGENFEQLFRPFFTTKPVGKALGLGLYSAHTIIERHNGQIRAFSQPGVTTTFEVILPLDNPQGL
ncbi:MAG: GAF domain-containing protein [Anaerolineae bacterium]|nr:GAF domain-containing protein [Anaerolineae bacterium]